MSVLVGKEAPDFKATAIMADNSIKDDFKLSSYRGKKAVVIFFYPLDFTFVCPTELLAFDHRLKAFDKKGVQVIGISVDSQFTHLAWKNTPIDKGGIGKVGYPLVADLTKQIARDYDVLIEDAGVALRGSFLIDKKGIVQHQVVNNLPLGRNIDEMLRMVDAMQFTEKHGEVCPAGWKDGAKGMDASPEGVAKYLSKEAASL
ncbi:MAG: tsaA [Gammaproteobacteria bacterium]|nr:MAG: tsaA [Gammaproteobacteria bacterium]TND02722.1 MAG: tsaA [Gammaproteobacteria bacterium]